MQGCFDALFVWIPAIVCASVIERMYDWSRFVCRIVCDIEGFSCYWKNVRLKRYWSSFLHRHHRMVSVVIERMYDWSPTEAAQMTPKEGFSCYWKNVRLKRWFDWGFFRSSLVSVVIERMYDWSRIRKRGISLRYSFSCYWKNVRLKPLHGLWRIWEYLVSVVIERMYDWSSETNWLKINDFWQLVSGLFFENGRSAQKVPLFSKIWGDCLTVFDSCGNI